MQPGPGATTMVDAVSVADFMDGQPVKRVHFLKMDCEGSEYEILDNLPADHFDRIDRLAIEFHGTGAFSSEDGATRLTYLIHARGYEHLRYVSPRVGSCTRVAAPLQDGPWDSMAIQTR